MERCRLSTPNGMASMSRRVARELKELHEALPPLVVGFGQGRRTNEYVFLVDGAPDSAYAGGQYVFGVTLSDSHPFTPPTIRCMTPSGRFQVDTSLCMTFSDFHPENWSSIYTLRLLVISLQSFMLEESPGSVGSIALSERDHPDCATHATRVELARGSRAYNAAHKLDELATTRGKP